jgi:hypothetical protein
MMNYAQSLGRSNLAFFFGSVFFAAALTVAAGLVTKHALTPPETGARSVAARACETIFRAQGFSPIVVGDTVQVNKPGLDGLETLVQRAGVLMAYCPGYTLASFCAGETCSIKGLSFTLKK